MRCIITAMSLLLVSASPAMAGRAAVVAAPATLAERIDAIAPGTDLTVTAAVWETQSARLALDVRFGPADTNDAVRTVWHANGPDRDSSMRRADIGRIVVSRRAGTVRLIAEATGTTLAAR